MKAIKKKSLILSFLIVCLISVAFGGATLVRAAASEYTEVGMYLNINEGEQLLTGNELLAKFNSNINTAGKTYNVNRVELYDSYVLSADTNGVRIAITPNRVGQSKFKVAVQNGTDPEEKYLVSVSVVAQLVDTSDKTITVNATVYEGVTTTVDFVNSVADNAKGDLVCVKDQLAEIGLKSFEANADVTDGNVANGITIQGGYIDLDGVTGVRNATVVNANGRFGFTFLLEAEHDASLTIPVRFTEVGGTSLRIMTVKFRFTSLSPVLSAPVERPIGELTQVLNGPAIREIIFNDLFQAGTLSGDSKVIIQNYQDVEGSYNSSKIGVTPITDDGNRTVGLRITPKSNGATQVTINYIVYGSSSVAAAKALTIPVEVNGIYTFQTLETISGIEKTFSTSDEVFKLAAADGYVFVGIEGECDVADVAVVEGKLVVKPKTVGKGTVTAVMMRPTSVDPENTRITVSIPVNVAKFNLFTYLSTAGIITMFTVGGVIVLVLIVMLILALLRHRKNKKLKQQIMRSAESKLQQKQEIQQRQRASMMQMSMMYNSMMRPQNLALNAAGSSVQRQNTLAIASSPASQSVQRKPILELNTAAQNSGYDAKVAKAEGAKKADAFMEEIKAKAKREAEENAKREAKLKEEQEKHLKEEAEKARRAAKIKQQQEIAAKQAEQKRAMEEEKARQQEKLNSERERLEAEKLKMQQEKEKMYLDTKRTEVINLNASLLDLYRQLASIDKLLFVKDMELDKINKNLTMNTEKLNHVETDEEREQVAAEIAAMQGSQETIKVEIAELENQAGSDDERRSKEESHIDAIVAECKFDDLKAEFERQRSELMRQIEAEYERYTKDYKNEFNTKEALEQAEKLRLDMIAQTERTKRENLQKAIRTKLATIEGITEEIDTIDDLTKLAQQEGKLNGVLAALLPEEQTEEVEAQIAVAQERIASRREELERVKREELENASRERREAASKEAKEIAEQMSDILRGQFEIDKQTYLDNFNKNRAETRMKIVRERLAVSQDEAEVEKCNAELKELSDSLAALNADLAAQEMNANQKASEGEALESKLEELLRENELDDVRRDIEYQSEILQRDLNSEYQKFVAKHKEDVARQDAIEEAERVRRQMQEQADRIKREAFNELMKTKLRTVSDLSAEIAMAENGERLKHYADSLADFTATLREEEKTPELMTAVENASAAAAAKKTELEERAKQEAEEKRVAEENAARIKSAVEAKRRELLGIKGEIPAISDMAGANELLNKLAAFNDGLPEELRVPEILTPIDKVHDAIVHAGEMAELRKTKVPQKKVIKKVVNNINRIKRPAPKKPGAAGAKPAQAGARPAARPAGARPAAAGARPAARPAGARPAAAGARPAARPAGARPAAAGARPAARPAGARPAAAGTRPAARPAGARPAARPAGTRPAPKR